MYLYLSFDLVHLYIYIYNVTQLIVICFRATALACIVVSYGLVV